MKDKKIFEKKISDLISNYNSGFFLKASRQAKSLLEKNKDDYQLCNIYGIILLKLQKTQIATRYFQSSIKLKPDFFEAHFNLLKTFYDLKKYDKVILQSKVCLKLNPRSVETLILLGNLYQKLDQSKVSESYYLEVLNINPQEFKAYYSLGNLYLRNKEYDKAIHKYKLAIECNKNDFVSYNNLASLYQEIGEYDLATSCFKSVIQINPKFLAAYQNYLYCLNFSNNYNSKLYFELASQFKQNLPKFDWDKIKKIPKLNKKNKKINIGFVSGDYGYHPVSYYLLDLINHINKKKFKLIAYSNSNRMDKLTIELKKGFDFWRKINHLNDTDVINQIKKDSINILFDLSGHTAGNRLSIFANKAAPIQVTWLGYNASTGLKEIDYIITDRHVVPSSDQKYFSEKIFHLKDTFQCISIKDDIKINFKQSTNHENIIFGSFNNLSKINDKVVNLWSKIINKVDKSKLYLKAKQLDNFKMQQIIKKKFQQHGISAEQIITDGRSKTREEMLKKYNKIDIVLDPFPYPGITTSLEAIWMGVPLITKKGNNFYSRIGESINKNLNMNDWIAKDENDYVSIAVKKASNLDELFKIKKELRNKFLKSPLSNVQKYTKEFENSLNLMWKNYLEKNNKMENK